MDNKKSFISRINSWANANSAKSLMVFIILAVSLIIAIIAPIKFHLNIKDVEGKVVNCFFWKKLFGIQVN